MRLIQARASELKYTLFRNNTGRAWVGTKQTKIANDGMFPVKKGDMVISNARPFVAGLIVGSSDLIGWKSVKITPDMVGKTIAVFSAVEVKTDKGRTSAEQDIFLQNVRNAGGIGIVARKPEDV